ncbi:MAG: D-2-hydroxyacid dehydrogenase [candidate division Zixibacteria bacterium]|nr:D-2-hydroxyacid dehydrogenase [candidate division Zixibacteria bacterium]
MLKKLKVVVALSEREKDYQAFSEVLSSSPKLMNRVELFRSQNKEHLKELLPQVDILVSFSITPENFQIAKNLKWIHLAVAGVDESVFPELLKSKVIITACKGMHSHTISEHILGMIMCFAKGIHLSTLRQVQKNWAFNEVMKQRFELKGKTLGIIGLGGIGLELAKKGKCLGMQIIGMKNRLKKGERIRYVNKIFSKEKLPELLSLSDFVALTLPLTDETFHLIGEKELAQMKNSAYLINTSRGKIIAEKAFVDAVENQRIAGAGLDVFEEEPLNPNSRLYDLENVIITPHVAGTMVDYFQKVAEIFKENLKRYLRGMKMINLVDKRLGY